MTTTNLSTSVINFIYENDYNAVAQALESGANIDQSFPDEIRRDDALACVDYAMLKLLLKNGLTPPKKKLIIPKTYFEGLNKKLISTFTQSYKMQRALVIDRIANAQKLIAEERAISRDPHITKFFLKMPKSVTQIIIEYDVLGDKTARVEKIDTSLLQLPTTLTRIIIDYDSLPSDEELSEERRNTKTSISEFIDRTIGTDETRMQKLFHPSNNILYTIFEYLRP